MERRIANNQENFSRYDKEIEEIKIRIKELEDILCPNDSHTYRDESVEYTEETRFSPAMVITTRVCTKCKKKIVIQKQI